jgi:hypothetical protein
MMDRGESVKLAAAVIVKTQGGEQLQVRTLAAKRGELSRVRAFAADIVWQSRMSPMDLAAELFRTQKITSIIWVTAALSPPPQLRTADSSVLWVDIRKNLPIPPKPRSIAAKLFAYSFPAGSDENRIKWSDVFGSSRSEKADELRLIAFAGQGYASLRSVAKEVLSLERRGAVLVLEPL